MCFSGITNHLKSISSFHPLIPVMEEVWELNPLELGEEQVTLFTSLAHSITQLCRADLLGEL